MLVFSGDYNIYSTNINEHHEIQLPSEITILTETLGCLRVYQHASLNDVFQSYNFNERKRNDGE